MAEILWYIGIFAEVIIAGIAASDGKIATTILCCFIAYLNWELIKDARNRRDNDGNKENL